MNEAWQIDYAMMCHKAFLLENDRQAETLDAQLSATIEDATNTEVDAIMDAYNAQVDEFAKTIDFTDHDATLFHQGWKSAVRTILDNIHLHND